MTWGNPEMYWDWMLVQGLKYTHKRHLSVKLLPSEKVDMKRN